MTIDILFDPCNRITIKGASFENAELISPKSFDDTSSIPEDFDPAQFKHGTIL